MRRFLFAAGALFFASALFAQTDSADRKNALSTKSLPRSNDHLMLQAGYLMWSGKPDSITTDGIPRTGNVYFLLDFPFKTNPHMSAAIGAGIGTDHMFFDQTNIGLKDATPALRFTNASDTSSFKKYKLATVYAEAPIELRYTSNPDNSRRSFKMALGAKVGTLLSAHVKGKDLRNRSGNSINDYKMKEHSKRFLNKNRLALTGRLGYGHLSVFGSYQVTSLFKEGLAPTIRPFSLGLTLSGL